MQVKLRSKISHWPNIPRTIEMVESEMFCNLCEVTSCDGNGAPTPLDEYNLELEVLGDGEL